MTNIKKIKKLLAKAAQLAREDGATRLAYFCEMAEMEAEDLDNVQAPSTEDVTLSAAS